MSRFGARLLESRRATQRGNSSRRRPAAPHGSDPDPEPLGLVQRICCLAGAAFTGPHGLGREKVSSWRPASRGSPLALSTLPWVGSVEVPTAQMIMITIVRRFGARVRAIEGLHPRENQQQVLSLHGTGVCLGASLAWSRSRRAPGGSSSSLVLHGVDARRSQLRAQLDTRAVRQHDVEHQDVKTTTRQHPPRIGAGFHRFHPVRSELQVPYEQPSP
jgi:hypothetical protein